MLDIPSSMLYDAKTIIWLHPGLKMPQQRPRHTKAEVKRLILDLLTEETGDDYSELQRRIDVDLNCDTRVDSLAMVNIVVDLEQELGIAIDDSEFVPERLRSLDRFAEFLVAKAAVNDRSQAAG